MSSRRYGLVRRYRRADRHGLMHYQHPDGGAWCDSSNDLFPMSYTQAPGRVTCLWCAAEMFHAL